jgi:uncharacterized protein
MPEENANITGHHANAAAMPRRHLPLLTESNAFFWQAGAQGALRFMHCETCAHAIHPPAPICPRCKSRHVSPRAVSGKAVVESYTINTHRWERGLDAPYAIAIVSIIEQPGVRLTTNIVNCPVDAVHVGMRVRVLFEQHEDVWLPLFEPDTEAPST